MARGAGEGDYSRDGYYSRKYGNNTILVVFMGTFPTEMKLIKSPAKGKNWEEKGEGRGGYKAKS